MKKVSSHQDAIRTEQGALASNVQPMETTMRKIALTIFGALLISGSVVQMAAASDMNVGAKAASADDVIADLCQSGKAEGEYDADIPTLNRLIRVRLYILCQGTTGMVATGYVPASGTVQSMVHVFVDDGDTISFLSWDPTSAMIAAGHLPSPELHVSIEALKNGVLRGSYQNQSEASAMNIYVPRNEDPSKLPPDILSKKNPDRDFTRVKGRFLLEHPERLGISMGFITLNIVAGAQVAHLNDGDGTSALLLSGLRATATNGDLFAINSGVDDGVYGASVINHIRGHLTNDCEIEFWFFTTQLGFRGPLLAKRMPATAPALEQTDPPIDCR
jgi:hypothetical protein